MHDTKLVVTGMGAVTPLGTGTDCFWQNLIDGRSGITRITRFDCQDCPVQIAGEIQNFSTDDFPHHLVRSMAPFSQFAFAAAREALLDAGLDNPDDPERIGVVMGSAMGGVSALAETQAKLSTGETHKVGPRLVPMILSNMGAGLISIAFGLHGASMTLSTACSSGGDAIMTGAMLLRSGSVDAVLCVGGESIINPTLMQSLAQAKALSRNNDDPLHACRPFDRDRDGFVVGEGGGAIVLETEEHAAKRAAASYATLAGCANTQDGYHITSPDPEGTGAARCMKLALDRAGIAPEDIGYINAHGTSTLAGDSAEATAMHLVFGDTTPPVSSTKAATGHMMGAGGITEVITCIKAVQTGILPPNLNYQTPDPDCRLTIVANEARSASIRSAMSNALGFGGQNSSVVVIRSDTNTK